ncbi:MAG: nucleotidyltransferase family protein [Mycobacterium sp.]|nr:nucleotidyltransferase family protein [Mycobacterium sp.]
MPAERIGGVLLAAGAGKRFGADKLAAELHGETLLQRAAAGMLDAGLDPVIAVVAPGAARPVPDRVTAVVNERAGDGIAGSVAAGLNALHTTPGVVAAVVAPADQPWCGAAVYRRLVAAHQRTGRAVIVATFSGALRNPVLLAREHWRLSEGLTGDVGLSAVVRTLSPLRVECADIGSVADVDTPADLAEAFGATMTPRRE